MLSQVRKLATVGAQTCFKRSNSMMYKLVPAVSMIRFSSSFSTPLAANGPTLASTENKDTRQAFMHAIHVHKYQNDYAAMFTVLENLCQTIIDQESQSTLPDFDLIVLKSFVHHAKNPQFGYDVKSSLLASKVDRLVRQANGAAQPLVSPSIWQTSQGRRQTAGTGGMTSNRALFSRKPSTPNCNRSILNDRRMIEARQFSTSTNDRRSFNDRTMTNDRTTLNDRTVNDRFINDRFMNDRIQARQFSTSTNDRGILNDRSFNDRTMTNDHTTFNDRTVNDRFMNDRFMNDRVHINDRTMND